METNSKQWMGSLCAISIAIVWPYVLRTHTSNCDPLTQVLTSNLLILICANQSVTSKDWHYTYVCVIIDWISKFIQLSYKKCNSQSLRLKIITLWLQTLYMWGILNFSVIISNFISLIAMLSHVMSIQLKCYLMSTWVG